MKNLNKEVEAEKKEDSAAERVKKDGLHNKLLGDKKVKQDASMVQEEQSDEQFTAHELAIQLKQSIQTTLQDMGIDSKGQDEPANDLVQVTADDFDSLDHVNAKHTKSHQKGKQEDEELNKQKIAHISRMEQKLTERINTMLNSTHRTDSDEGELEDVFLEVKPLRLLN